MGITKIKTTLYCIHCEKETQHELIYVGDELEKTKCLQCGMEVAFDKKRMLLKYSEDFVKRVITKPKRITKEAFSNLSEFLKTIPIRVITKPKRIAKEVKELLDD